LIISGTWWAQIEEHFVSVRLLINRHRNTVLVMVVAVVGICAWVTWSNAHPTAGPTPAATGFFTVDEGKTLYVDDLRAMMRLDKDGKRVARAYLYRCGNETPVVGYLERYTEKWWALREKYRDEPQPPPGVPPKWVGDFAALGASALEVKRPGDSDWLSMGDPSACNITSYTCKDGGVAVRVPPPTSGATASANIN
jgi:hypothetical protein